MALSRTGLTPETSAAAFGAGNWTTAAVTPVSSSLLVVTLYAQDQTGDVNFDGADLVLVSNTGGLTFTSRVSSTTHPGWGYGTQVWTAPVTTGVSTTITFDAGAFVVENYRVEYACYTGYDSVTPVGATAVGSDADGDGAATITLSAAPASTSEVIAFANISKSTGAGGSVSPGTGWTAIADASRNDWWDFASQFRAGSTSSSVDWLDLSVTGVGLGAALVALEIRDGGGAPPVITAQPENKRVNDSDIATFTVAATGGALSYQWKRNGSNVGTNSASYSVQAFLADNGALFTVDVTDSNGTVVSSTATLEVRKRAYAKLNKRQSTSFDYSPGGWFGLQAGTTPAGMFDSSMILAQAAAGGGTAVGLATEADTAFALAGLQTRALGLAAEIDTALALTVAVARATGLAVETNTAFALARLQIRATGIAVETDTALTLGGVSLRATGLASEADTAFALAAVQVRATGRADETDTAFAAAGVQLRAVGRADETDTAFALTPGAGGTAAGMATETDSAFALSGAQIKALGRSDETDSALALTAVSVRGTGLTSESDTAFALAAVQSLLVGLAIETDTAFALDAASPSQPVGMAQETDTAFALESIGGAVSLGGPDKYDIRRLWKTFQPPVVSPVGMAVERAVAQALKAASFPAFGARLRAAENFKRSPWPEVEKPVSAPAPKGPQMVTRNGLQRTHAPLQLQRTESESRRKARIRELEAELTALRR